MGCGVAVNDGVPSTKLARRIESQPNRTVGRLERLFGDARADGALANQVKTSQKVREPSTLKVVESTTDDEVVTAVAEELIEPEQPASSPPRSPSYEPSLPASRALRAASSSRPNVESPSSDDGFCSCGQPVCGPEHCCLLCGGRLCPLTCVRKFCERPTPGPPPVTTQIAMPPKFLPVPTHAIVPPARPDAPEFRRGDVEAHYGPQLWYSSPGRD